MDHAEYAAATAELRRRLLEYVSAAWASVTLSDSGLRELTSSVAPVVQAAQESMAAMTSVYIAEVTQQSPVQAVEVSAIRGVPSETVYARPVITARTALSEGKSVAAALRAGQRRIENLAGTDLQLAKTHQARSSFARSGVQFYRRVLTGSENCALCVIASTMRYRKNSLMPIHPGCDCDIDVIPPGMDFDTISTELLNETHDQVKAFASIADRGGRAVDYRKLIVTREHGEVGPVLAWRDQKFSGPRSIQR
ncbi:head maturation protease [Mycobacterium phage Phatniss]|uniref:Capsid maturation protease n=5 Tax=Cheoctovirus TaxID=1623281 RepID=A0A3G3LZ52_9CAUD|nr:head maturation protease [Mycobacterium phage Phatniss]YP_009636417.1 head maturation protease [Mycobacterium phage DLane]YP_009955412.1 head maturation protease [Mycobacterium phage Chuckly]YP_009956563.1 head maturation protease [Mycobacterium phage Emma]YP_009956993.1 head maturation protease [Mycobacterium phage Filuzino]AEK08548.1 capsid maturation protease [Mycobacterium phage DLane]AKY02814.1 capsid maturation protease [Mycobacterium phage Phatniss]ASZ72988.1 capsid maturation prot